MKESVRRSILAAGLGLSIGCLPSTKDTLIPPHVNPFIDKRLYVNPDSEAAKRARVLQSSDPETSRMLEKIASQPTAVWFGDWNTDIRSEIDRHVTQMVTTGHYPVAVLYNIPNRDYGGYSAGGARTPELYLQWIDGFVAGTKGRSLAVVFEPDGIGLMDKRSDNEKNQRLDLYRQAIDKLTNNTKISVYIEAAQWVDPDRMAGYLERANLRKAAGVCLNTSGYELTPRVITYLENLNKSVKYPIHGIIDTSRNGRFVPDRGGDSKWCNPLDAGLGVPPTTDTKHPLVDAFLWIKIPGESDGECGKGDSNPGIWDQKIALSLAKNASW
jgi:endoglucanase